MYKNQLGSMNLRLLLRALVVLEFLEYLVVPVVLLGLQLPLNLLALEFPEYLVHHLHLMVLLGLLPCLLHLVGPVDLVVPVDLGVQQSDLLMTKMIHSKYKDLRQHLQFLHHLLYSLLKVMLLQLKKKL